MKKQDTILYLSSRKHWLLLIAMICLSVALGLWLFCGKIETTATGRFVLASESGCEAFHQPYSGYVTEIYAQKNGYVKRGDKLLSVYCCKEDDSTPSLSEMRSKSVDVMADFSGYIIAVNISKWDRVSVPTSVMTITKCEKNQLSRGFVAIEESAFKKLKPGKTKARVYGKGLLEERYGFLKGTLTEIWRIPLAYTDLLKIVGTDAAATFLLGDEKSVFIATVQIDPEGEMDVIKFLKRKKIDIQPLPNNEGDVVFVLSEQTPYERIFLREK